jgi:hypothetical protein
LQRDISNVGCRLILCDAFSNHLALPSHLTDNHCFRCIRHFLSAYFSEKGKNLASKEDLEELTRNVEGIKTKYSGELERLRFDLSRASLIHKAQYETEFHA